MSRAIWDQSTGSTFGVKKYWPKGQDASPRRDQSRNHTSSVSLLPELHFSLDLKLDTFSSSYYDANELEKAVIRHSRSCDTFSSQSSTIIEYTKTQLSKASPTSSDRHKYEQTTLPPKRCPRILHYMRYTLFTVYRRIFCLVFLGNVIGLVLLLHLCPSIEIVDLNTIATIASTNLLVAISIRQDFIVNLIFRTAWLVPWSVPLRIRLLIARCYCYGGIHSGAALAGTMWWLLFTALLSFRFARQELYTMPLLAISWTIFILLAVIVILAFPKLRERYHNTFELTHRFLGWTSVALFWAQLVMLTHHAVQTDPKASDHSFLALLVRTATFYNLTIITLLLIYPWLTLRRHTFTADVLSSHALRLSFDKKLPKFSCLSIAKSPLGEWHPFATFPFPNTNTREALESTDFDNKSTNSLPPLTNPNTTSTTNPSTTTTTTTSLIISSAGDWTTSLITHAQQHQQHPPPHLPTTAPPPIPLYTKSLPHPGLLSLTPLFHTTILLTTGSGIGPSLSSLLHAPRNQHIRLIWATRSPLKTYGSDVLELVHRADPRAVVIDTDERGGRPDLVSVVCGVVGEMGGRGGGGGGVGKMGEGERRRVEAVFVLSNRGVVGRVVRGLEGRGVRAFGPVWDS